MILNSRHTFYACFRVNKGDDLFKGKKYNKARSKYERVLSKIDDGLPPRKKKNKVIEKFVALVKKRISDSYYMVYVNRLENVDKKVKGKKVEYEKEFRSIISAYGKILSRIDRRVPNEYQTKKIQSLKSNIRSRQNEIYIALTAFIEKEGDSLYNNKEFKDAINRYKNAKDEAGSISDTRQNNKIQRRLDKKISIAQKTGQSYISSRVNYLMDMAIIEKTVRNNRKRARSLMKKAKRIAEQNRKFLSKELYRDFNETASVIGVKKLNTLEELAGERKQREEKKLKKQIVEGKEKAKRLRGIDYGFWSWNIISGYLATPFVGVYGPGINFYFYSKESDFGIGFGSYIAKGFWSYDEKVSGYSIFPLVIEIPIYAHTYWTLGYFSLFFEYHWYGDFNFMVKQRDFVIRGESQKIDIGIKYTSFLYYVDDKDIRFPLEVRLGALIINSASATLRNHDDIIIEFPGDTYFYLSLNINLGAGGLY